MFFFAPASPPKPCPPVAARPRQLSVSRVERMLANPYEIFASIILELEPLAPLGKEPDAALRGTIIHKVLRDFTLAHPERLPADIEGELLSLADDAFKELGGSARVEAFWRPGFQRFAHWFAATEPLRRNGVVRLEAEVDGALRIEAGEGFTLTARADRIDIAEDGALRIYDYKSGYAPTPPQVDELYAPQLPLEAAIALRGGFARLGPRAVSLLRYIKAHGRGDGGDEADAGKLTPDDLGRQALKALQRLIERFDRADTPYEARRRPAPAFRRLYDFDDYAQLARVQEWAVVPGDGEGS